MNLVIDFGNTRIKAALFQDNAVVEKFFFSSPDELVSDMHRFQHVKRCLICSVTDGHNDIIAILDHHFETILFSASTPVPLINRYHSARTLGSDRMAAAVGAWTHFPDQNVLSVDAGTCIKYNFVNQRNEYLGGAISPGIPMRLQAMNNNTHALPLVELSDMPISLIGTTTHESIYNGAVLGSVCEVDAMIDRYRDQFPGLQVVITGGDAHHLTSSLKNRFFANQNLLLQGLNAILQHLPRS